MKKSPRHYGQGILMLLLFSLLYLPTYAHDHYYHEGKCITNWNQVDRDPTYFQKYNFAKFYPKMPGNTWIKSTEKQFGDNGGDASHITKFTTDAGTASFEPADGVLYKFNEEEVEKSISVTIADPDKYKDNKLYIAVLIKGHWTIVTSFKTTGKYCYVKHTTNLPDATEAVLLYTPEDKTDVYLGRTCIASIPGSTLPVAVYDVVATRATASITWKAGAETGIDSYRIEGSNDAHNWVEVKTISSNGQTSYSTSLSDLTKSVSLYLWLMLAFLPITLVKGKRRILMGIGSLLLLSGTIISCSKQDSIMPKKDSSLYKYYRIQSLSGDIVMETSKTITIQ